MTYEYDYNDFPFAYLITLRTFGTWLHGDEKTSVDRHGFNVYGTPRRAVNQKLRSRMLNALRQKPFLFSGEQQAIVEKSVAEVCSYRGYELVAVNAQSNHLHAVVSAQVKPELIINAFKTYATRKLREENLITGEAKIWARGGSRKYLWKPGDTARAVEYVLYGQGDIIFEFED